MKKLFVLLRQGNLEEVKKIIETKPELLNCVAGPQPKKDHGQSLLQVALKSGNFDIADYLIDRVIPFHFQGVIHRHEDIFHFPFFIQRSKFSGGVFHSRISFRIIIQDSIIIQKNGRK